MDRLDNLYARMHDSKTPSAHTKGQAMNKQQLIDAIRKHNNTADQEFLLSFDDHELDNYLQRLTNINNHRGPKTVWVRDVADPNSDYQRSA